MTVAARALVVPLLFGLALGCGPKRKAPVMPEQSKVEIPDSWGGVSFDDEVASLDAEFREASDADGSCGDPLALEPVAMMGKLTEDQIVCLEHALRLATRQTTRDGLSRVIMADAWAKRDMHRWEGAVRRHLEEIDRSDPDLPYVFAVHLAKKGYQDAYETIRYAEFALENKDQWGPETHADRVESLLKVRALAAQELWHHYEREMLFDRSPEVLEEVDQWRAQTKALSREWLEWAHAADSDVQLPYEMCVSASGTLDYCEIGFEDATGSADAG